nr:MAG TPA: hypothetical protein [Caudoviricetes sp.]
MKFWREKNDGNDIDCSGYIFCRYGCRTWNRICRTECCSCHQSDADYFFRHGKQSNE